jgi:hypothetical protein
MLDLFHKYCRVFLNSLFKRLHSVNKLQQGVVHDEIIKANGFLFLNRELKVKLVDMICEL